MKESLHYNLATWYYDGMLLAQQYILMIQYSLFAFLTATVIPMVLTILLLGKANIFILMKKQCLCLHWKAHPHLFCKQSTSPMTNFIHECAAVHTFEAVKKNAALLKQFSSVRCPIHFMSAMDFL